MQRREALGAADTAWLRMESAASPMVVDAVVELAEALPLARAEGLLARLVELPRFRSVLVMPGFAGGRPHWEAADHVDVAQHVEELLIGKDEKELRAVLGERASALLDPTKPLWKLHWIHREGLGTVLFFRVHHAIADGFGLLSVLGWLSDQGEAEPGARSRRPAGPAPPGTSVARTLWRLLTLPPDPVTILRKAGSSAKSVAWTAPIPLDDVKALARQASATVNDLLVAMVAGALGRTMRRLGETTEGLEVHGMLPVNLRPPSAARDVILGNHFGLVLLGLPVGIEDPVARVLAVKERMGALKTSREAVVTHAIVCGLGGGPAAVERVGVNFFAKKASLVLTNVPGPREPLSLVGTRITRMMFWVPQPEELGLGLSIMSYAGQVTVGVIADARVLEEPRTVTADVEAELAALTARLAEQSPRSA